MQKYVALFLSLIVSSCAQAATPVTVGQSATLTATADGTPPFTWQWFKNGTKLSSVANPLLLPNMQITDSGSYTVIATNSAGSSPATPAAILAVTAPVAAPVITVQPKAMTALVGSSATFTVVATGTGLTYQWKKDGVNWPYPNTSATTATFVNPNLALNDAGNYSVVVTNAGGSVESAVAGLTVIAVAVPSNPAIAVSVK